MTAADGRPTQALKWVIANQRYSSDDDAKRRAIGSAIAVWLALIPIILVGGSIIVWLVPALIDVRPADVFTVRATFAILVLNLVISGLVGLPNAVLRGMNLGYKRMGVAAALVVLSGVLTVAAVRLGWGLVGVSIAECAGTTITAVVFWVVTKRLLPWLGVARPSRQEIRRFFGYSGWLLFAILMSKATLASDVVLLGMIISSAGAAVYTLTGYVSQVALGMAAMILAAALPGLGGILGKGDVEHAAAIRSEMMALSWLLVIGTGVSILAWNHSFVTLWVGRDMYAGSTVNLLLVLLTAQLVFQRNDSNLIDVSLDVRNKAMLGGAGLVVSVALGWLLGSRHGMAGLVAGFLAGRMVTGIAYPVLAGSRVQVALSAQARALMRPGLVTAALFGAAFVMGESVHLRTWPALLAAVAVTSIAGGGMGWVGGLDTAMRRRLWARAAKALPGRRRGRV
jgi:O-antigen/teichoic acid export membrane protein